jgi:Protein of unknown function (DUF2911)
MNRSLIALLCLVAVPSFAQLKLPAASPAAKVSQTVGLTDITVDYSSPAVKGRKIWGALVPMDKVWRAGANKATTITFSMPVTVGETAVPAGTYGFFAIPGAASWTLILNKIPEQWGAYEYKQDADLVRLTVKPTAIPNRERLAYAITNFTNDAANIDLEWEKVRVTLPVKLKTGEQTTAAMKKLVDDAWVPMNQAARYSLDQKDFTNGLMYVDKSIAMREHWFNQWTRAQLLAGAGKFKDASAAAEKAQALGAKDPEDFPAEEVKKAIAEWKTKS